MSHRIFHDGFFACARTAVQLMLMTGVMCHAQTPPETPPETPALSPSQTQAAEVVANPLTDAAKTQEPQDAAVVADGGDRYLLDPLSSSVRIYAFRGGKAARMGHNHVLSAPQFEGFFVLAPGHISQSRFDLSFRLDQLEFDNPEHRAALGGAFASLLDDAAIQATRENMLGNKNFQSAAFPLVRIQSLQIAGEAPKFAARVAVDLHGQTREQWVALTVKGLPDGLTAEGAFVLRQSDFGVTPFSVLGGLLAIQDEVVIEFVLKGAKAVVPQLER